MWPVSDRVPGGIGDDSGPSRRSTNPSWTVVTPGAVPPKLIEATSPGRMSGVTFRAVPVAPADATGVVDLEGDVAAGDHACAEPTTPTPGRVISKVAVCPTWVW